MLVGGVIIDNQVQIQIRRGRAIDLVEEADELLTWGSPSQLPRNMISPMAGVLSEV
jgi:hypothetical protein